MNTLQGNFTHHLLRKALSEARIATGSPVRVTITGPGQLTISADWLRTTEAPEARLERLEVGARLLAATVGADMALDRLTEQREAVTP